METQTNAETTSAPSSTEAKATRESGVWLIFAKDKNGAPVLAERKSKKEAQAVVAEVGVENVLALYKQARLVELKTKVQVQF